MTKKVKSWIAKKVKLLVDSEVLDIQQALGKAYGMAREKFGEKLVPFYSKNPNNLDFMLAGLVLCVHSAKDQELWVIVSEADDAIYIMGSDLPENKKLGEKFKNKYVHFHINENDEAVGIEQF